MHSPRLSTIAARALLFPLLLGAAALATVGAGTASPAGAASGSGSLPTVSGAFGTTPTITFPSSPAPTKLESKVLVQGHGPAIKAKDVMATDYLGQIWGGKVFNSSYSKDPIAFEIGANKVIKGWDDTLVGKRVGSRVLIVIPPAYGYGKKGESSVGITGTDTLAFVVDILGTYNGKVGGDPKATVLKKSYDGVTVKGPLGGAATLVVAKNAPRPTADKVVVMARGHGAKVTPGLIIDQYYLTEYGTSKFTSSWKEGVADYETVGSGGSAALNDFVGIPIGSRVLVQIPKSSSGGPYAAVFDIVAQPKA